MVVALIVVMVGSIHAAIADEASDAVQVLSKLWEASLDANDQDGKPYTLRYVFVGDGKTFKMRVVARYKDGEVGDSVDEAPFRVLEEGVIFDLKDPSPLLLVGVQCLFDHHCIYRTIYDPNAQPKKTRVRASHAAVDPANYDRVRQALHTLLRLNAAPPFEPPKAPR
jgi:hypothetical protein